MSLTQRVLSLCAGPTGPFRHIFLRQGFEPDQHDVPQRQKVEFRFQLHVGDSVDLIVWPRTSHDCDGIYLVDMQIWEHDGMKKHTESDKPFEVRPANPLRSLHHDTFQNLLLLYNVKVEHLCRSGSLAVVRSVNAIFPLKVRGAVQGTATGL